MDDKLYDKNFLQGIMEIAPVTIMVLDNKGKVMYLNQYMERVSGYSLKEILNKDCFECLISRTEKEHVRSEVLKNFHKIQPSFYTCNILDKHGHKLKINWYFKVINIQGSEETALLAVGREDLESKDNNGLLCQKNDETLKKSNRKSNRLMHTEKLIYLGVTAASIAHDLLNPLMGIINFIQYCMKHTSKENQCYSVLHDAEEQTRRCIKIVESLLSISHVGNNFGDTELRKCSCISIIEKVLSLLSHRFEKDAVHISKDFKNDVPDILLNEYSIQKIFTNILTNSLYAVSNTEKKDIHIEISQENGFVMVAFTYTGCGIAPENIDKIYEPFFTTKPVGKGTGLGLFINRNIVNAHSGKINCISKPGHGARFEVLLPVSNMETSYHEKKNFNY